MNDVAKIVCRSEELGQLVGKEVAVTDWFTVSQERIDAFAGATEDHQWIHVDRERAADDYGLNRVRFTGPVPAGSRVRARFRLAAVEDIAKGVQTTWDVTVEREGEAKPVLVAEWITRRHE